MAGVNGVGGLLGVTAVVFLLLRGLHVATPVVFPDTRQGPIAVARIEDVRQQLGVVPLLPAYRPDILGDQPGRITIWISPIPTVRTEWRGASHDMTVTQRRGGPAPPAPPLARPLDDLAGTAWWMAGGRSHLRLLRDGNWLEFDTSLPSRELRRFVDTLTTY